jgi:hypothetical protein
MTPKEPLIFGLLAFQPTAIFLFVIALFSTAVMQMLSVNKNFNGTQDFMKKMFPGWSAPAIVRVDFALIILIGPFIGIIFFNPTSPVEAMSAGFGWVGILNTLVGGQR